MFKAIKNVATKNWGLHLSKTDTRAVLISTWIIWIQFYFTSQVNPPTAFTLALSTTSALTDVRVAGPIALNPAEKNGMFWIPLVKQKQVEKRHVDIQATSVGSSIWPTKRCDTRFLWEPNASQSWCVKKTYFFLPTDLICLLFGVSQTTHGVTRFNLAQVDPNKKTEPSEGGWNRRLFYTGQVGSP